MQTIISEKVISGNVCNDIQYFGNRLTFAIVIGWVLAILFPYDAWPLFAFVPVIIGVIVNSKLVKDLRQKVIPIENEIDRKKRHA